MWCIALIVPSLCMCRVSNKAPAETLTLLSKNRTVCGGFILQDTTFHLLCMGLWVSASLLGTSCGHSCGARGMSPSWVSRCLLISASWCGWWAIPNAGIWICTCMGCLAFLVETLSLVWCVGGGENVAALSAKLYFSCVLWFSSSKPGCVACLSAACAAALPRGMAQRCCREQGGLCCGEGSSSYLMVAVG